MLNLNFLNSTKDYKVDFKLLSDNRVEIKGKIPKNTNGFMLSRIGNKDSWTGDYSSFTTIYKVLEDGLIFSNDGSVYVEPEPVPEYVPTEEEIAERERQQRIAELTNQINMKKSALAETDYQIIKTYEYSLVGKISEYDIETLHAQRELQRQEINDLELQLLVEQTTE